MSVVGCIADDFTGATDVAGALVKHGLRVVQFFGAPTGDLGLSWDLGLSGVNAYVVAMKTRSVDKHEAVDSSLSALRSLRELGAKRVFFKYCSTFDSTPEGNIGPVAEALMDALDCRQTILCPAFPQNGRTQYLGHLFVGEKLLNESSMRDHPLTPMCDPNLLRVLERQSSKPVGLVDYAVVDRGQRAIRTQLQRLEELGKALILIDSLCDQHLRFIADAVSEMALVTGGAALGGFLADTWRRLGVVATSAGRLEFPVQRGPSVLFSGSCSQATQRQVASYARHYPTLHLDILSNSNSLAEIVDWAVQHRHESPLIHTTVGVSELQHIQSRLGAKAAAERAENLLAEVAFELVDRGFGQLIVAGGETAGAIIRKLGIEAVEIGPEICPGVPWTQTLDAQPLSLALKSGNFGGDNFFADAQQCLRSPDS